MDTKGTVLQFAAQLSAGDRTPTARELSTASGVSVGSIYHHFGSLDEVLEQVRQHYFAMWVTGFIDALGSSADAAVALEAAYRFHRSWQVAHPGRFSRMTEIANAGALGPEAQRFALELGTWLAQQRVADEHIRVAGALVLGPLIELSRQSARLDKPVSAASLRTLAMSVAAGIRALAAHQRRPTSGRKRSTRG